MLKLNSAYANCRIVRTLTRSITILGCMQDNVVKHVRDVISAEAAIDVWADLPQLSTRQQISGENDFRPLTCTLNTCCNL